MSIFVRNFYIKYITPCSLTSKIQWLCRNYSQPMLRLKMNEAILLHEEGTKMFKMSFRYVNLALNLDRQFNFRRNVDEPIHSFVERIDRNINRYLIKKLLHKRKKYSAENSFAEILNNVDKNNIKFVKNDCVLNDSLTCKSILEESSNIKLIVFDAEYVLRQNVPIIIKIELPSCILIDFPIYPSYLEGLNTDKSKSIFNWYKYVQNEWIHLGEGFFYTPCELDVQCKLKLTCIPKNGTECGPLIEVISNNIVTHGPDSCPFDARHSFTKDKLSGKSFRIVSYNILANVYSETSLSKDTLYPYCPPYALSMDYRKLLLLKELLGYNSDIMCLQEVDGKIYENDFLPFLSVLHYDSIHNCKHDLREGLAIFYNKDRFDKLFCDYSVISKDANLDEFNIVWSQIQNGTVQQTFQNRNTIVQVMVLRSKENPEILVIGNTHLYFRPNADHIRLLQAYYSILYLHKLAKKMKEENPDCNVSILYCGDFNSVPQSGVYQLLTQNYVRENHNAWTSCPEEHVQNVSIKHDLNLSSACGTPKYTNFTATFSGCLDYIFYQTDYLTVKQVIPMPSEEEVKAHTGLPSIVFPSDHISLCVDLKWLK